MSNSNIKSNNVYMSFKDLPEEERSSTSDSDTGQEDSDDEFAPAYNDDDEVEEDLRDDKGGDSNMSFGDSNVSFKDASLSGQKRNLSLSPGDTANADNIIEAPDRYSHASLKPPMPPDNSKDQIHTNKSTTTPSSGVHTSSDNKIEAERLNEIANQLFKEKKYLEAIESYQASLDLHRDCKVYSNKAQAHILVYEYLKNTNRIPRSNFGHLKLAEDLCSQSLSLNHKWEKSYSRRGLVKLKMGKYLEAAEDFSHCIYLTSDKNPTLSQECRDRFKEASVAYNMPLVLEKYLGRSAKHFASLNGESDSSSTTSRYTPPASDVRIGTIYTNNKSGGNSGTSSDKVTYSYPSVNSSSYDKRRYDSEDEEEEDSDDDSYKARHSTSSYGKPSSYSSYSSYSSNSSNSSSSYAFAARSTGVSEDTDRRTGYSDLPSYELSPNEYKERGNGYFKKGDFQRAIRMYSEALNKDPDFFIARVYRSQASLELQDYEACVKDASVVLNKFDNRNIRCLLFRAKAYIAMADRSRSSLSESDGDEEKTRWLRTALSDLKALSQYKRSDECNELTALAQSMLSGIAGSLETIKDK